MKDRDHVVLLHGSANGAFGWKAAVDGLTVAGVAALAPDMLGYGRSPPAGVDYGIAAEVLHLQGLVDRAAPGPIHLVTHSLGTMFGLHLRRLLGPRVRRLTLVDPIVVSVLREPGEAAALAEMDAIFHRVRDAGSDADAARIFVDHWNGAGSYAALGERARAVITGLMPKVRLEMSETRDDRTPLRELAAAPPRTRILVGGATLPAAVATARQLARAFDGDRRVIPGAGHMLPITHPKAVIDAILMGP